MAARTVLVTGAAGFIGRNLMAALADDAGWRVTTLVRGDDDLAAKVAASDAIVHLAGANRPPDESGFQADNAELAARLADAVRAAPARRRLVIFASSTQAALDNPYGRSKRAAEDALAALAIEGMADVALLRLPNVFGRWARPRYNSAIATFCDAAAHGQPLPVNDPAAALALVHVDDVVTAIRGLLASPPAGLNRPDATPVHRTTVGEIAGLITAIAAGQPVTDTPLTRALADTYASAVPGH